MQLSVTSPVAERGVHQTIGDLIRGAGSGYAGATHQAGVEVDRASIHPFESVTTATGLLRDKTSGIKGVGRATSVLHTAGGLAMLIASATVSGAVRAPGRASSDAANRIADLIDGGRSAAGFGRDAGGQVRVSAVGQALAGLGMR